MSDILSKLPDSLANSPVPFFRTSCGCIGFYSGITHQRDKSDSGHPMWSVVEACDAAFDENMALSNGNRYFTEDKTYTPLTQEESFALIKYLNHLIHDGYRWRAFCASVKWANEWQHEFPKLHETQTQG